MTPLALGLTEILRQWKLILAGLLLIALLLTRATLADTKTDLANEQSSHRITVANYRIAQAQAWLKHLEQIKAVEDKYRRNADEAQANHVAALADADARTADFIARNRVQPQGARCEASGTAAAAQGGSARVPEAAPAVPELVAITADDVRACTQAVIYGQSAHQWAKTLNDPKP